ncbi:MAG: hypothetical protein AB1458_10355 [Bacteroidota bacterium]
MHIALQVLIALVPSLAIFATSYFMMKSFIENETRRRQQEIKFGNKELITPVRLQAYERVVLFLERISPNSLVMRVFKNGMSGKLLQAELIKSIRGEYEHNMSQQVYMSNQAWELVKTAKEETIKLINIAGSNVPDTASGLEFANAVIDIAGQLKKLPTQVAIEALKLELSKEF